MPGTRARSTAQRSAVSWRFSSARAVSFKCCPPPIRIGHPNSPYPPARPPARPSKAPVRFLPLVTAVGFSPTAASPLPWSRKKKSRRCRHVTVTATAAFLHRLPAFCIRAPRSILPGRHAGSHPLHRRPIHQALAAVLHGNQAARPVAGLHRRPNDPRRHGQLHAPDRPGVVGVARTRPGALGASDALLATPWCIGFWALIWSLSLPSSWLGAKLDPGPPALPPPTCKPEIRVGSRLFFWQEVPG